MNNQERKAFDERIAYIEKYWTDAQGVLSKEQMQKDLSKSFQMLLLFRSTRNQSVSDVVEEFTSRFGYALVLLDTDQQDEILLEAQKNVGVDLSKWLGDV